MSVSENRSVRSPEWTYDNVSVRLHISMSGSDFHKKNTGLCQTLAACRLRGPPWDERSTATFYRARAFQPATTLAAQGDRQCHPKLTFIWAAGLRLTVTSRRGGKALTQLEVSSDSVPSSGLGLHIPEAPLRLRRSGLGCTGSHQSRNQAI